MFGLKDDWSMEVPPRYFTLEDYEGGTGRWCPGCGDFAVLSAVQRLLREKQLRPEKVVCVSGIGCAGRFPHYMGTYGRESSAAAPTWTSGSRQVTATAAPSAPATGCTPSATT